MNILEYSSTYTNKPMKITRKQSIGLFLFGLQTRIEPAFDKREREREEKKTDFESEICLRKTICLIDYDEQF